MTEPTEPIDTVVNRPFRPEDTDAVLKITAESFEPVSIDAGIERMFGPPRGVRWDRLKCETVRKELAANPRGVFVAEADGRVAGYVTTIINGLASRGTISNLAVDAAFCSRGIGRRLLDRAVEHFRELKLAVAKIETLASNPVGQHLYPQLGFQESTT